VVRVAVRTQKAKGRFSYGVLIGPPALTPIWAVLGRPGAPPSDKCGQVLAYVHAYDARGGGVESSLKADKQGLGLNKRNKKRFRAQQMVTMLSTVAHNIVIWTRGWLVPQQPKLARYGIVRLVRDLFHISGRILFDAMGHIVQIVLNQAAPMVRVFADALRPLLVSAHIAVNLGET
jgi:Transposase DDE domain group 1